MKKVFIFSLLSFILLGSAILTSDIIDMQSVDIEDDGIETEESIFFYGPVQDSYDESCFHDTGQTILIGEMCIK